MIDINDYLPSDYRELLDEKWQKPPFNRRYSQLSRLTGLSFLLLFAMVLVNLDLVRENQDFRVRSSSTLVVDYNDRTRLIAQTACRNKGLWLYEQCFLFGSTVEIDNDSTYKVVPPYTVDNLSYATVQSLSVLKDYIEVYASKQENNPLWEYGDKTFWLGANSGQEPVPNVLGQIKLLTSDEIDDAQRPTTKVQCEGYGLWLPAETSCRLYGENVGKYNNVEYVVVPPNTLVSTDSATLQKRDDLLAYNAQQALQNIDQLQALSDDLCQNLSTFGVNVYQDLTCNKFNSNNQASESAAVDPLLVGEIVSAYQQVLDGCQVLNALNQTEQVDTCCSFFTCQRELTVSSATESSSSLLTPTPVTTTGGNNLTWLTSLWLRIKVFFAKFF